MVGLTLELFIMNRIYCHDIFTKNGSNYQHVSATVEFHVFETMEDGFSE